MSETDHNCSVIIDEYHHRFDWKLCCTKRYIDYYYTKDYHNYNYDHMFAVFCLWLKYDYKLLCKTIVYFFQKDNRMSSVHDFIISLIETEIYHVTCSNESCGHLIDMINKIDYLLNYFNVEISADRIKYIYNKIDGIDRLAKHHASIGVEIFEEYINKRVVEYVWIYFRNIENKSRILSDIIYQQLNSNK